MYDLHKRWRIVNNLNFICCSQLEDVDSRDQPSFGRSVGRSVGQSINRWNYKPISSIVLCSRWNRSWNWSTIPNDGRRQWWRWRWDWGWGWRWGWGFLPSLWMCSWQEPHALSFVLMSSFQVKHKDISKFHNTNAIYVQRYIQHLFHSFLIELYPFQVPTSAIDKSNKIPSRQSPVYLRLRLRLRLRLSTYLYSQPANNNNQNLNIKKFISSDPQNPVFLKHSMHEKFLNSLFRQISLELVMLRWQF